MADDGVVLARYTPKVQPQTDNGVSLDSNARTSGHHSNGNANHVKGHDPEKSPRNGGDVRIEDAPEEESDPCGWGPFTFSWCQRLRDPRWFVVVITLCGACQGMAINGFVNTAISTLERRFEISSTESGLIASCYDIMFVLLVIPISYFGGRGHKPRYLGIGILVLGLGSFVFSLPHFITAEYVVENAKETVCMRPDPDDPSGNFSSITDPCASSLPSTLSNYKYFFFLGQMLHGAGATALYTLGVVYLDENVSPRSSSFYNGIFYTGAVIGPAVGFILGSEFLSDFTEVGVDAKSMGLDTNNPKWVGRWWLGFIISGIFAALLSLPLLAFPRSLPGAEKYAAQRGKEVHAQSLADDTGKSPGLRDILLSIRLLLTNVPFMLINLAAAADGVVVAGFSTFMPKFIEYQFGYPAGTAAFYVGLVVVPTGGGATLASGYIVRRFNLKVRGILRFCTVLSVLLCFFGLAFLMECENAPFSGVTLPYGQLDSAGPTFLGKQLDSSCNADCGCAEQDYFPMCGRDNVLYFSPCYAGCTEVFQDGDDKLYANCSCVNYNLTAEDLASGDTYQGQFGKCSYNCEWFKYFMPLFGIMIVLVFGVSMPSLTATLRCIPDHQRSFALGIQWIVARCLGSIPGPIMFGRMFDLACVVWQKRCDGTGSCFFYNNHDMSINLMILAVVFCVAAAASFGLALFFYKVKGTDELADAGMSMESIVDPSGGSNKAGDASNHDNQKNNSQAWMSSASSESGRCYDNQAMEHDS
ncbi:hypothetical protein RRG08_007184 [Elysia crispata]|uniref:Solute carrier organic anion transporter family member n=1 Tax=Elysia crispata TaxID=231223 RepID=A0AAE1E9F4_9GAST|nr:hypothetical protein RRG08_007184 [Elysia crispata]